MPVRVRERHEAIELHTLSAAKIASRFAVSFLANGLDRNLSSPEISHHVVDEGGLSLEDFLNPTTSL